MTDEDAIRAVVLGHVESWFDGDAARMARTLHPRYSALEQFTAKDLVELTARGEGRDEDSADREISIEVSCLDEDRAKAICLSHRYAEVLQLARTSEGWKILNGIWQTRAGLEQQSSLSSQEQPTRPLRCQGADSCGRPRRPGHPGPRARRRR
jgi:hypothetical protein